MIERENIISFLNKKVQLVKLDGFVISGIIRKVNNGSITFENNFMVSVINLNDISEIRLKKEADQ